MTLIKIPKGWELPESAATSETFFRSRRRFLRELGYGTVGLGALMQAPGCFLSVDEPPGVSTQGGGGGFDDVSGDLYPAARNEAYTVDERPVSSETIVTRFNNYYEFTTRKDRVWELVDRFDTDPWTIEVKGLCNNPQVFDLDTLVRQVGLEERLYRLRCVEAWSITVPWTGFPLSELLRLADPTSAATHVRFVSVLRPEQMPGIDARPNYPWAYHEGLRLDEAMNELAFLVTGAYGAPLLSQNGAPVRLALPWKYGYKSIKSIVEIEFVAEQPATFWNTIQPREYSFLSNVNPNVPHPRWSQARERHLTDVDEEQRRDTLLFNGYADYVGHLYPEEPRS
jgi:sulfoxide reductase catalytic subunit YedY